MWQVIGKFIIEMLKIIICVFVERAANWFADKVFKTEPEYA
jgi:hypothetical protein